MKVLVTGGAGFIGSHLVDELVTRGEKVRVIDNFATGKMDNIKHLKDNIELIRGDIRNKKDLSKALKGVKIVFHQAALRSVPRSLDDPMSSNDVNITGTLNLLIACREFGVKRVVYASSSSVYGDNPLLPKQEFQAPSPVSPYAVSKLAAEHYCQVFRKVFGLETVSLRYFNVFGPRQDPQSLYAAVVPRFIADALENKPLEIHGDGKQSRDFTYIRNVVSANILASEAKNPKNGFYNIACNERYTVLDIAKTIEKILGKKAIYKFLPGRKGDVRHTLADITLAKKELKYKIKTNFYEGMKKTVEYFQDKY